MRDRVSVDPVSLAAGVATIVVGAVVVLDSSGAIDFSAGWIAVVLTAAVGAVLVLSGLADGGAGRHD